MNEHQKFTSVILEPRDLVIDEATGLTVTLLKKTTGTPEPCEWVGGLRDSSDRKWKWMKQNYPEKTAGWYVNRGEDHFLAVVRVHKEVLDVYDLRQLLEYQHTNWCDGVPVYDGRHMTAVEILALKKSIAEELKLSVWHSPIEMQIDEYFAKQAEKEKKEKLAQAEEARKAKREREEKEKQERRAEAERLKQLIFGRKRLKGFREDGKEWSGVPVVGDEWQKLSDSSFCVSVTSYNDETNECGEPIECFIVAKDGARKKKKSFGKFSLKPTTGKNVVAIGGIFWIDSGVPSTANVYKSLEDLEALRKAGMNGGTRVALREENAKFRIYSVTAAAVKEGGAVEAQFTPFQS